MVLISCTVVFYLIISKKKKREFSGFDRIFVGMNINLESSSKFRDNQFGFLSEPDQNIWFYDYTKPLTIIKANYSLTELQEEKLKPTGNFSIPAWLVELDKIDSTIIANNQIGDIVALSSKINHKYKLAGVSIDIVKAISPNSVIGRGFTNTNGKHETQLIKIMLLQDAKIKEKYTIPRQVDGMFDSDGMIYYDKLNSKIFYMFYHRGSFLCLDTNLNLKYKAKTVDTINTAKIKLVSSALKLPNGKTIHKETPTAPLNLVNRYFATDKKFIYINSGLEADNELDKYLSLYTPIDVYSIEDGSYLHSFYLPKYKGFKASQFKIKGNILIAIYRNYIVTFSIKEKLSLTK